MKYKIIFFLFFSLIFFNGNAQCAMCRAVLESEESQSMAEGVNDGIQFLMVFPYLLVGGVAFLIYWKFLRSKKEIQ